MVTTAAEMLQLKCFSQIMLLKIVLPHKLQKTQSFPKNSSFLLGSRLESIDVRWRPLHTTAVCQRVQAGRYRRTTKCNKALTYEMANPPFYIAHRKSWNSWNTSSLLGGLRPAETTIEDLFIRRFMTGTWHNLFLSEVIIKRQHNVIRVAGLIKQTISARKMYFLIGYTEEMLANWLQCPVQLELQSVADPKKVVFQYV